MRSRIRRELVAVVALRDEPLRILHEHRAELPGRHQRSQRVDEAGPHLVERVGLEVVRVEVALRRDVGGELVAQVAPQRRRPGRMPGEQRVRLDVHREPVGVRSTHVRASCGDGGK